MNNFNKKIRNWLKSLLWPKHVHIEYFWPAMLDATPPGLVGWATTKRPLRVVLNDKVYAARFYERPDVQNAFFIELPRLDHKYTITVEQTCGRKKAAHWQKSLEFVPSAARKHKKSLKRKAPGAPKKAVIVHAYYPDILLEYENLIKKIPRPVDFYLVTPEHSPAHQAICDNKYDTKFYKKLFITQKIGRDIGGFLPVIRYLLSEQRRYEFVLFWHTKKSPQFPENMGTAWRDFLIQPLISRHALEVLNQKSVHMVGCSQAIQRYDLNDSNSTRFKTLCDIFALRPQPTDFVAGTMFWLKFSVIQKFFSVEKIDRVLGLLEPGSPPEPTYAHAFERFWGLLATQGHGLIEGVPYPVGYEMNYHPGVLRDDSLAGRLARAYKSNGIRALLRVIAGRIAKFRIWNLMFPFLANSTPLGVLRIAKFRIQNLMFPLVFRISRTESAIDELYCSPVQKPRHKRLCIFASYCQTEDLPEYVYYFLKNIVAAGYDVLFVSTAPKLNSESKERITQLCFKAIFRPNVGYDFGSWKTGLFSMRDKILETYEVVLLTNDSIFAPLYPKRMKEILQQNGKGILGMTDSYETDYHLQSYFLMVFKDALHSDVFWEFWHSVKMLPMTYKLWIIREYEIGFTQKMLRAGFSAQAIYKIDKIAENYYQYHQGSETIRQINPTHKFYRQLIELKAPMLKRDLWKLFPDFRSARFWEDLVSRTDYDIAYIKDYLRNT